jgi:hypothetical protein
MKGYRVIRRPIGLVFECEKCDYKIELEKEFPGEKVPRSRTLAATWMNGHIARTHPVIDRNLEKYGIR